MILRILRLYQTPVGPNPQQTESIWYVIDNANNIIFQCVGLELPWLDNKFRVSCIPAGNYKAVKHVSPKFGDSFWIKDVPARSGILIHRGNFVRNTAGCLLPGVEMVDIDKDGFQDVTRSVETMLALWAVLPAEFDVVVVWRS